MMKFIGHRPLQRLITKMFKGVRAKVENEGQYKQYLEKLEPVRQELGVSLQEELYPKNE